MDPLTWITEVVMSELPVEITFIAAGWLLKIIWDWSTNKKEKARQKLIEELWNDPEFADYAEDHAYAAYQTMRYVCDE